MVLCQIERVVRVLERVGHDDEVQNRALRKLKKHTVSLDWRGREK